jgi:hypothetical protein
MGTSIAFYTFLFILFFYGLYFLSFQFNFCILLHVDSIKLEWCNAILPHYYPIILMRHCRLTFGFV